MNNQLESLLNDLAASDDTTTILAGSGDRSVANDSEDGGVGGYPPVKLKRDGSIDRRVFNVPKDRHLSGQAKDALRSKLEPDEDSLHNATVNSKFYTLQHEKPEHRIIIFLKAEGHSNVEIATLTGYSPVSVSNILKQPWAQRRLVDEITKSGRSQVEYLLKGAAVPAVKRLIEEMDNPDARSSERSTAADKLLDRLYGKAAQPIVHSQSVDITKLSDAEIAERIAKLSEQQNGRS